MQNKQNTKQLKSHVVYIYPYIFFLWTVEGTSGVENCLLSIVEKLGDVLQVLC